MYLVHQNYMAREISKKDVEELYRVMMTVEAIQHEAQAALQESDPQRARQALERIEAMSDTDARMGVVRIFLRWIRGFKGDD